MHTKATPANEGWSLRETTLDLETLAQKESIFALSNGHIGLRGNLDEGEPYGLPGTYLNSVYELFPLAYADVGHGDPEWGQTVINVTNGKLLRLLVDDEPFDVRYGKLLSHERELDFRDGVLRRDVTWASPTGKKVNVSSVRMVSFAHRAVAAICYEVEPVDQPMRVVVQSELVANEMLPTKSRDPRTGMVLESPLECKEYRMRGTQGMMIHQTRRSGLVVGAAMDHLIEGPADTVIESEGYADVARVSISAHLKPGQRLRIIKFIAYGWSAHRSRAAIHDQVMAALFAAKSTGWEGMLREQRAYLDDFWARADVQIDGDPDLQQATRFALFHVLQSGARGEQRPIPAKALSGPGYDGHTFWDTETFVLPVLTFTMPHIVADVLRWRHSILDMAKARASHLGLRGAAFPWRTIHGEECSGYWPASTAGFHINADIAYAVTQYVAATGDTAFEEEIGLELLVETARLWMSLGCYDSKGTFRINGVTGPDEYSAIADNNVYTNLMAQRNLRAAATTAQRYPKAAHVLHIDAAETAQWLNAADKMFIPYDARLGVTPQDELFTEHEVWDFENTPQEQYPLLLHFPYFQLYRKQVVKQADLVLAQYLCGDAFTAEQKARDFAYYEGITVRDSSLSAGVQAIIAAEVGHLQLAHDYLIESAFVDLRDLGKNGGEGIHLASLAGTWTALTAGFGGMRLRDTTLLSFAPRLPDTMTRLAFHITFRGSLLHVSVDQTSATYHLLDGDKPMVIEHHGKSVTLTPGEPTMQDIPAIVEQPRPEHPLGRAPVSRGRHATPKVDVEEVAQSPVV